MKPDKMLLLLLMVIVHGSVMNASASPEYSWLETYSPSEGIANRITVPRGYERIPAPAQSFETWLRNLPLKPGRSTVYLYNGQKKSSQNAHAAVVNIEVGEQDLQQCADAVIRLRAEYLYAHRHYEAIHFNFTSGDTAAYLKWRQGHRPIVQNNRVTWHLAREPDSSYETFRRYLHTVFMYAGSASLEKELVPVEDPGRMQIGDVFIQGGFPGHAAMVVDMAQHHSTGKKSFLLVQSYMPAQDIHVLRNPAKRPSNPWFELDFGEELRTPEWTFKKSQLKRFRPQE